jgi:hypothetical protein
MRDGRDQSWIVRYVEIRVKSFESPGQKKNERRIRESDRTRYHQPPSGPTLGDSLPVGAAGLSSSGNLASYTCPLGPAPACLDPSRRDAVGPLSADGGVGRGRGAGGGRSELCWDCRYCTSKGGAKGLGVGETGYRAGESGSGLKGMHSTRCQSDECVRRRRTEEQTHRTILPGTARESGT